MPDWSIEHLGKHHDRRDFSCGNAPLDRYIKQIAGQNEKRSLSRTYVLVRPGEARVFGYYSWSTCQIKHESLPPPDAKGLPLTAKIPAVLLGRLAVDVTCQGQGLGNLLLSHVMRQTQDLADQIGILALTVDAIDDRAKNYYLNLNFTPFLDDDMSLFMFVETIRNLGLRPIS